MLLQSYRPRLSLSDVLILSLMFSQALFMSSLSPKFSIAANLNLILFHSLQLPKIKSLHIKRQCFTFTYCQSFHNFCNHQTVFSITVSFPERSYIEYTRMPSHIYQYVINLVVSIPIRIGPGMFINVLVREHYALHNQFFGVAKFTVLTPF
jgi:hypothetical protein